MRRHDNTHPASSGWTLFELLLFIAACAIAWPVASRISHHFDGIWQRVTFVLVMLTIYPALGLGLVVLFGHITYYRRKNRLTDDHTENRNDDLTQQSLGGDSENRAEDGTASGAPQG